MAKVLVIKSKEDLRINTLKRGQVHRIQIHLSDNALGVPWRLPLIIIRGNPGPVLGITAALHGNELNGISTIFKLIDELGPQNLNGTLVLVPISNVPGYLANQRYFSDNVDLNRIIPGNIDGNSSQRYVHDLIEKVIQKFDYLLDLHTASEGRVNSLYIRAELDNVQCRTLAYLQNPDIIVNKYDEGGTLRGWANENGIPAITIEIGNPNAFQHNLTDDTLEGILNTMRYFKMIQGQAKNMAKNTVICNESYWIYSRRGGLVDVSAKLKEHISIGQVIAKVYDVFGRVKEEIVADRDGVVIGRNIKPNCEAGTRVLHLGISSEYVTDLPKTTVFDTDNYS